jgi:hypothetical protein
MSAPLGAPPGQPLLLAHQNQLFQIVNAPPGMAAAVAAAGKGGAPGGFVLQLPQIKAPQYVVPAPAVVAGVSAGTPLVATPVAALQQQQQQQAAAAAAAAAARAGALGAGGDEGDDGDSSSDDDMMRMSPEVPSHMAAAAAAAAAKAGAGGAGGQGPAYPTTNVFQSAYRLAGQQPAGLTWAMTAPMGPVTTAGLPMGLALPGGATLPAASAAPVALQQAPASATAAAR